MDKSHCKCTSLGTLARLWPVLAWGGEAHPPPSWGDWRCMQCVIDGQSCMQCVIDGQSPLAVCACYGLWLALYVGLVSAHLSPLCGGVAPAVLPILYSLKGEDSSRTSPCRMLMQVKWFVKNYQPGKPMVVILAARQGYCNHWALWFNEDFQWLCCAHWGLVQSISSWLSKNCDENSRMRKISYSKFPPKCAHARILVAIFGQPTGNRLYQHTVVVVKVVSLTHV